MATKRSESLLLRAQPLGAAEELSRRMVEVRVVDGALLLDADPAWAGAINTVLVKKGVRVNELRPVPNISPSDTDGSRRSARPMSDMPVIPRGGGLGPHRPGSLQHRDSDAALRESQDGAQPHLQRLYQAAGRRPLASHSARPGGRARREQILNRTFLNSALGR